MKLMDVFKRANLFEKAIQSEIFADTRNLEYKDCSDLATGDFKKIGFYLDWKTEDFADVIGKVERVDGEYFFLFTIHAEKNSDALQSNLSSLAEGLLNLKCPFVMYKRIGKKILSLEEFYRHPQIV